MRKKVTYALALALALLPGCRKEPREKGLTDSPIRVMPGNIGSRGFIGSADLGASGDVVKVYDWLTGFSGTISGLTGSAASNNGTYDDGSLVYIDDIVSPVIAPEAAPGTVSTDWAFSGSTPWRWTRSGNHSFFGWLHSHDGVTSSSWFTTFTPSMTSSTRKLTVAKELTIADSDQYDFLYSDVVNRDPSMSNYMSVVSLPMNHLFGAFALTVRNASQKKAIVVTSVKIINFPNSGSAEISFDGSSSFLSTETPVKGSSDYFGAANPFSAGIRLPARDGTSIVEYDVFTGNQVQVVNNKAVYNYKMVWPMRQEVLSPSGLILDTEDEGYNLPERLGIDPMVELKYHEDGESTISTTYLKLPRVSTDPGDFWVFEPGKKTHITIQLMDKMINMYYSILKWDYHEIPMAFETGAVSSTQLKFESGTYDSELSTEIVEIPADPTADPPVQQVKTQQIVVKGSTTIQGSFKIYTPVGALLRIGVSGDLDYFHVTPSSIIINPDAILTEGTAEPGRVIVRISPVTSLTRTRDMKIKLHFSVETSDGREIDADTEINRDNYTIVYPQ